MGGGEDKNISATCKMMGQEAADMVEERFSFSYPPPPPTQALAKSGFVGVWVWGSPVCGYEAVMGVGQ